MSDYISREAAENEISRLSDKPNDWIGKENAINAVDAVPAADVVEVVRCKDCRYSYEEPHPTRIAHRVCTYGVCVDCEVEDDFYCANGAKKESDGE